MNDTMTKTDQSTQRLIAAFKAHERAKTPVYKSEENPFANHDLMSMATAGLMTMADMQPARNAVLLDSEKKGHTLGFEMESARLKAISEAKADSSTKRMAAARTRAARKAQFDAIMESPVQPSAERMGEAWQVMAHLFPTIVRIAEGKARWAARFLGDVLDDVSAAVLENMALMLAKSDKDLDLLERAARQIGDRARATGQIEGNVDTSTLTDDEKKARKQIGKARKWLMQVANNRVMDTLVDVYFRSHNLRWENIDIVATVMATINGVGDDPITNRFKADRAPAFLGTRFPAPGGIDATLLAAGINAAITERGLDRMVELLLDKAWTNGAFPWTEHAEEVFMADPSGDGEWMWQVVVNATTGRNRDGTEWVVDRARKARGDAARKHVREMFSWLPSVIASLVDSFDQKLVGYAVYQQGGCKAILASEFEGYLGPQPERREMLSPVLKYADATEAAEALIQHLSHLVTGNDLVAALADA